MQYKIKNGDTLSAIAKENGTTVSEIAKLNGISDPNRILAGATLELPSGAFGSSGSALGATGDSRAKSTGASGRTSSVGSGARSYSGGNAPTYSESSAVRDAFNAVTDWEGRAPGEYSSKWKDTIDSLIDDIANRESFSYDPMSDPAYRRYRDEYSSLGRLAMMDTLAEAASLTGGYGNSYGQTAADQAYKQYLSKLSGVMPTLRSAALDRYNSEGDRLSEMLSLYRDLESGDYERYRQALEDYYGEGDYLWDRYRDEAEEDYKRFSDLLEGWYKDRDYELEREKYESDLAYKKERAAAEDEYRRQSLQKSTATRSASGKVSTGGASSAGSSEKSSSSATSASPSSASKGASSGIAYSELSDTARGLLKNLTLRSSFDFTGKATPVTLNLINSSYRSGRITSAEYDYIMKLARGGMTVCTG